MDALSQALQAVQMTGAIFFGADLSAPWALESPASSSVAPSNGVSLVSMLGKRGLSASVNAPEPIGHAPCALGG